MPIYAPTRTLTTWSTLTQGSAINSGQLIHGNGTLITCHRTQDSGSTLGRSTDGGATWGTGSMPSSKSWVSAAYGGGTWVAVAYTTGTSAAYSTDGGATWSAATLPTSAAWRYVAYGGGNFVAIAGDGSATTAAAYSTDGGATWGSATLPASQRWMSVAYGSAAFVATAGNNNYTTAARSTDGGQTWASVTTPLMTLYGVGGRPNGVFVAVGPGQANRLLRSTDDGVSFSLVTTPQYQSWYGALPSETGTWLATPILTTVGGTTNVAMVSYDDGATWVSTTLPATAAWRVGSYAFGKFFVPRDNSSSIAYVHLSTGAPKQQTQAVNRAAVF